MVKAIAHDGFSCIIVYNEGEAHGPSQSSSLVSPQTIALVRSLSASIALSTPALLLPVAPDYCAHG